MPAFARRGNRECDPGGDARAGERDHHEPAVHAQEIRQTDQRAGQERQPLAGVLEDLHHLRHDVHQQADHHDDRDDRHQRRIDEGESDLAAQPLAVLGVVGEPPEHLGEPAGTLARFDQRHVDLREGRRVVGERARERLAGEDVPAHPGEELAFAVALGLLDRRVQRLLDGEAGAEQRRELAGEERQRRGAEPIGSTSTGSQPCSRSRSRAWRGLSDSSTPRSRLPSGVSAT